MALTHVGHRISHEIAREKKHSEERENAQEYVAMLQLHSSNGYVKFDVSQHTRRRQLKGGL
jgi:hypothetical protein